MQDNKTYKSKSPEVVKAYNKQYYAKNKQKILESMNRMKKCEYCDKEVRFHNFNSHCRGLKHKFNVLKASEDKE